MNQIAQRFIRTLKNKTYQCMASRSKYVHINKLDDIVNKYNNTCHRTVKMKSVDVKQKTYVDPNEENNNEDPNLKFGDIVQLLKYKNIFAKGYVPNWYEEVSVIKKKLKTLCHRHMLLVMLKVSKLLERFTKNNCKKQKTTTTTTKSLKEFRAEKVIKRKSNKLLLS